MNQKNRESVTQKFEFRNIRPEETDQAVMIEQICFPPNEACSEAHMRERIEKAPELFLVAEEKESGKIAGFLNGLSTNEETFRDEFFTDADLYEPEGKTSCCSGWTYCRNTAVRVLRENLLASIGCGREKMAEKS